MRRMNGFFLCQFYLRVIKNWLNALFLKKGLWAVAVGLVLAQLYLIVPVLLTMMGLGCLLKIYMKFYILGAAN